MNRYYQLAKLVQWAGRLESRKRMQKVVYLLQAAGCPLGADFYLHRYGPYSTDVAQLTDEMVRRNLLREFEEPVQNGSRFSYTLTDEVEKQVVEIEKNSRGQCWLAAISPFEDKARTLLRSELKELEYASTIAFFYEQSKDWNSAVDRATEFKHTTDVKRALPLAQQALS